MKLKMINPSKNRTIKPIDTENRKIIFSHKRALGAAIMFSNEQEKHYSMQYKTGLNVNCEPFNPAGVCTSGGIYFTRKDILAFLNYGPWIRQVILPEDAQVYEDPWFLKKWKTDKIILGERKRINLSGIKELICEGADIHAREDFALRWASENGHLEIVKFLMENGADIHAENDCALRWASENGHLEIVKFLIENEADIHAREDSILHGKSLIFSSTAEVDNKRIESALCPPCVSK